MIAPDGWWGGECGGHYEMVEQPGGDPPIQIHPSPPIGEHTNQWLYSVVSWQNGHGDMQF